MFAELFGLLSQQAAERLKREGDAMVRLLDATPIPLPQLCSWATSNGRTRGMKLHVVYNPHTDHPMRIEVTPANVNDITAGQAFPIELVVRFQHLHPVCRALICKCWNLQNH